MIYLKVRIAAGTSDSIFNINYESPNGGGEALLADTNLPAVGITNDALLNGEGVTISVPDNTTSITLDSSPGAFCGDDPNNNENMYTINIGCTSYTISSSEGIFNYSYTDCDCNNVTETIDATDGYIEETFCALKDTVNYGLLTLIDNGACSEPPPLIFCYPYQLYNFQESGNLSVVATWINCDGTSESYNVAANETYTITCAREGSVVFAGPTTQGQVICNTPLTSIALGYSDYVSGNDACNNYDYNPPIKFISGGLTFADANQIFDDEYGFYLAYSGIYSDGSIYRYWDGFGFTGQNGECTISGD